MKLWTIQDVARLAALDEKILIFGSPDHGMHAEEPDTFGRAYTWMLEQMGERLEDFSGNYPIWAGPKKPDLRQHRHQGPPGKWHVRIEFEVLDKYVLLSDFDLWHHVLNRSLTGSEAEWEDWCKRGQPMDEAVASWEHTFDLTYCNRYPEWFGETRSVQACVDGLATTWVRDVTLYKTV